MITGGNMSTNTKLAAKLLKIFQEMGSVPKKGHNKHQNYYYMREVDVMEALKEQLIANKVIMLTSSKFVDIQKKDGKDKTEFVTTVETIHTFLDTESGEKEIITSVGSGYDSSDKGASKAITAAFKYAVTKTFMISDEGADIENDGTTIQPPVVAAAPRTFNKPAQQTQVQKQPEVSAVTETKVTITETPKPAAPKVESKPAAETATAATLPPKTFARRTLNKGSEPNF